MESLEIVGKDVKSFTKKEFKNFLAERICEFSDDALENTSEQAKFIIEFTLATFSAEIITTLFDKEN